MEECLDAADADDFCGKMIEMNTVENACHCVGVAKQRTCTKDPKANWNVYSKNPGNVLKIDIVTNMKIVSYMI